MSSAQAQSQNEVQIEVLFDGAGTFAPADATNTITRTGTIPEPHTPGLDASNDNGVVRIWDGYGFRIDWNINEDSATNAVLIVELPAVGTDTYDPASAHSIWTPDATGMFSGCDAVLSSISADGRILTCHLGDLYEEGSHGVIRPTVQLLEVFDNTTFDVNVTLITTQDPTGVNDSLPELLTVSEGPSGNWIKETAIQSPAVTEGGVEGYVVLYELYMIDNSQYGQMKGLGPIDDLQPISFFDHYWQQETGVTGTPNATLATPAQIAAAAVISSTFTGRTPCGKYDGTGDNLPLTTGTWTCGTVASPNGYPVVPISISGATTRPFPTVMADGTTPNSDPIVYTGQIAFWLPKADVDAAIADTNNADATNSALLFNTISADDATLNITSRTEALNDITQIPLPGSSGYVATERLLDNTSLVGFGAINTGGDGGWVTGHNIMFRPGPLQLKSMDHAPRTGSEPSVGYDSRYGGSGGFWTMPGEFPSHRNHGHVSTNEDFYGDVSRGEVVSIIAGVYNKSATSIELAFSQCIAFDNTHYSIIDLPTDMLMHHLVGSDSPVSITTVPPNQGPAAHFYGGEGPGRWKAGARFDGFAVGQHPVDVIIEFSNAPIPTYNGTQTGINDDELTCDFDDAGSAGWVASTGDLSVFDTANPGDGIYEGITQARVRALNTQELLPEHYAPPLGSWNSFTGWEVMFNAKVKTDINVQTNHQELMAFTSHAFSSEPWDGTGTIPALDGDCHPWTSGHWDSDDQHAADPTHPNHSTSTGTGWCTNRYWDDGIDSYDTNDLVDMPLSRLDYGAEEIIGQSGDMVRIVTARLDLEKENLAGLYDIKDNGQYVTYTVDASVIGSDQEALVNVVVTDTLSSAYTFISLTQPTTPGSSCTYDATDHVIVCRYSEEDPFTDTGALPPALPGGWPDGVTGSPMFTVALRVDHGVAHPEYTQAVGNRVDGVPDGVVPWDVDAYDIEPGTTDIVTGTLPTRAVAYSYLPLATDENHLYKELHVTDIPCEVFPGTGPVPADWFDTERCQMVDYEQPIIYTLSISNSGNTEFNTMRYIDVLPYNGDGSSEPASNTPDQTSSLPNTIGDARTPESTFAGTLDFVGLSGANIVYVSGDAPNTISRDPDEAEESSTWCELVGTTITTTVGTTISIAASFGGGACPTALADVTAIYAVITDTLIPSVTNMLTFTVDVNDYTCDDVWTNTSGLRVDEIFLPVRSNDVSVMPSCFLRLGGLLWEDNNNDEIADSGDTHTTFVGVEVHLYDISGTLVATTTADANGEYIFEYLFEGDYQVRIPDTAANQVAFGGFASSNGPDSVDGQVDPDNDLDNDDNGYADSNVGFLFSSLPISLTKESELTSETDGIDILNDESDANAIDSNTPEYPDNNSNLSVDFGFIEAMSSLALSKMLNTPEPVNVGQSVIFTIRITNTGDVNITTLPLMDTYDTTYLAYDSINGSTPATDDNGNDGQLDWSDLTLIEGDLAPGDAIEVIVHFTAIADTAALAAQSPCVNAGESCNVAAINNATAGPNPVPPVEDSDDVDIEYVVTGKSTLGDFVWYDTNGDGIKDLGEPGINGVIINLYGEAGLITTTVTMSDVGGIGDDTGTTNGDGFYDFQVGRSNVYTVEVDPANFDPGGALEGYGYTGNNAAMPYNGDETRVVLMPVDQHDENNVDFSYVMPLFELSKTLNTASPVRVNESVSFTIRITNTGTVVMNSVPLIDRYSSVHLSYISASPPPDNPAVGELIWNDLTNPGSTGFGMDLNPGEAFSVVVEFIATLDTTGLPNDSTVNLAVSQGITDTDEVQAYAPTSVEFTMREATYENKKIVLRWETADEADVVGFHIYRQVVGDDDSESIKLTSEMLVANKSGSASGEAYTYEDETAEMNENYRYFVGILDVQGVETQEPLGELTIQRTFVEWLIFLPITLK